MRRSRRVKTELRFGLHGEDPSILAFCAGDQETEVRSGSYRGKPPSPSLCWRSAAWKAIGVMTIGEKTGVGDWNWRQGNLRPEVPRATLGGRTPKQSVGVFVVLSLASHNVGPNWDDLNPDDPKVPKGGFVLYVFHRHQYDLVREGPPSWPFSTIGVVVGCYGVLERVSFLDHLWCTSVRESLEVERVSSLGHEW
ncbi:hypothetical protein TIFTF001_009719 [Ficus carica]|uniref:Uncharacterized protein n=1 Tax=Ficus carica TaxID=3494 RepID=A0AA87ZVS3_FICCA|nr:hypothetical protein TIFTF001_009719 [Ficus carica]